MWWSSNVSYIPKTNYNTINIFSILKNKILKMLRKKRYFEIKK